MNLQLTNKTAFISGSTAGIGFSTALHLAREGASVYLNGRSQEGVEIAVKRLKKEVPDAQVYGLVADFLDTKSIDSLIKDLPEVDILINNVGIYASASFFETDDASWQRQLEVNLMSGVRLSRHYLKGMLKQDWGRILFISSECATLVPEDLIAYSTTKAALLALSRGLAQLTKGSSVTVNTIAPGSTFTEGAENFIEALAAKEGKTVEQAEKDFFENIRTSSLLGRFAAVDEVAQTICYFASPLSSATNGSVIKVDGGSMGNIL